MINTDIGAREIVTTKSITRLVGANYFARLIFSGVIPMGMIIAHSPRPCWKVVATNYHAVASTGLARACCVVGAIVLVYNAPVLPVLFNRCGINKLGCISACCNRA